MERTSVLVKPEVIKSGLVGEVIKRIENSGFKIESMKMIKLSRHKAELLYEEHRGRPFFDELIKSVTKGHIMVVRGRNAVQRMKEITEHANPSKVRLGTIRHDPGFGITKNIMHASTDEESAERRIKLFFE